MTNASTPKPATASKRRRKPAAADTEDTVLQTPAESHAAESPGGDELLHESATAAAAPPVVTDTPSGPVPAASLPTGKLGEMVALLRRPKGVTIGELSEATGWQVHSVRGAISGALKKKYGLTITSEKADGVRRYRLAETQRAAAAE